MRNKFAAVLFVFLAVFSAPAQQQSNREGAGLRGYVRSIKEETVEIVIRSGKPREKRRVLDSIETFDIAGKTMTSYNYMDDGEILYGDTYIYDANGKLIEKRTVRNKFVYLCDKKTYLYDQNGKLSEEICHLDDRGVIGKRVYRYDDRGKLFEEESFPLVEAPLYYSGSSLKRYQYHANGNLRKISSFRKEGDSWVAEKDTSDGSKYDFFSNDNTHVSTSLKYDGSGKLVLVEVSYDDGKGNDVEAVEYLPDGTVKSGNRSEFEYDREGNYVKETAYEWVTEDGTSFFRPTEATYRTIEYFRPNEIREFEAKNKSAGKQPDPAEQSVEREEYAVYDAIIDEGARQEDIKRLVIKKFTRLDEKFNKPLSAATFEDPKDRVPAVELSAIDDFNRKNVHQRSSLAESLFTRKVTLVSDAELNEMFSDEEKGWRNFAGKYDGSIRLTTLSRVGFSRDRIQAIVYYGDNRGGMAATGHVVVLQKRAGKWAIVREQIVWSLSY